jgi:hypothetical protein
MEKAPQKIIEKETNKKTELEGVLARLIASKEKLTL